MFLIGYSMQQPIKEQQKSMFALVSGVGTKSTFDLANMPANPEIWNLRFFSTLDYSKEIFAFLAKKVWWFVLTLSKRLIGPLDDPVT